MMAGGGGRAWQPTAAGPCRRGSQPAPWRLLSEVVHLLGNARCAGPGSLVAGWAPGAGAVGLWDRQGLPCRWDWLD